jgi:tetratricopeptide (TPR) repeat protein
MIEAPQIDLAYRLTDGAIALNNLESTRQGAWSRFWRDPPRPGVAEYIVEQEQLTLQFLGDPSALDRLEELKNQLEHTDPDSPRTALVHAQVASAGHRFAEAKVYLGRIAGYEPLASAAGRLLLSIDQACGIGLAIVLEKRRKIARDSGRLEDLVPLGALHADLGEFDKADRTYQRALTAYVDASPFPVAWVCFQLGALWGELVPEVDIVRAAFWYQKAIGYLPQYVKARVHLAEIYLHSGNIECAEALLLPMVSSADPEVHWHLADVMVARGRFAEAEEQKEAARSRFEVLLKKHLLAFADHGAEFYSASRNDARRALELACINLSNRPTLRAFERAYAAAIAADEPDRAAEILATSLDSWGDTPAFGLSALSQTAVKGSTKGELVSQNDQP